MILLSLSFVPVIYSQNTHILNDSPVSKKLDNTSSAFIEHEPIVIPNNYNLSTSGFPGSGTKNDPYRIENYEIDGTTTCINIQDTTLHIKICDCVLRFSYPTGYYVNGIYLQNVTNVVISNCTIIESRTAIAVYNSVNCSIEESTIREVENGIIILDYSQGISIIGNSIWTEYSSIDVQHSNYITMKFNTINSDYSYGITCYQTDFGIIADNTVTRSYIGGTGVYLRYSDSTTFANNSIDDNYLYGLSLFDVNSGIYHNNCLGNGVSFSDYNLISSSLDFSNNLVHNKPLGFLYGLNSIDLNANEYGQLILIMSQNISISNGVFDKVVTPININYCFNCSISNIVCTNSITKCIILTCSDNCSIIDCSISDFQDSGIYVTDSDYLTIRNSELRNSPYANGAIYVSSSLYCTIDSNEITNILGNGIRILYSSAAITNNQILGLDRPDLILLNAYPCVVTDNEMQVGVQIVSDVLSYWYHTFSGNLVSGNPIGYFTDVSNLDIENNGYHQIIFVNATGITLSDGMSSTNLHSISFMKCSHCDIHDLIVESAYQIENQIQNSDNIVIQRYTQVGTNGLYLEDSNAITISDSTVNSSLADGISARYCFNVSINRCIVASNRYGIYFYDVQNSSIVSSIVLYNEYTGISLSWGTQFCNVYYNEIGWNANNAYDQGSDNIWDDGVNMGNYWNDYAGTGVYLILGPTGSIDRYPRLLERYEPSVTTSMPPFTTTFVDPYYTPTNPIFPPGETYTGTEWYLHTILGIPIITILGAAAGLITLFGITIVMKRET